MSGHLTFRSGNPALNKNTFKTVSSDTGNQMTLEGTVNKTGFSLLILIVAALFTWNGQRLFLIPVGMIGGLILALATIFNHTWSPITVPLYAAFKGLALGGISIIFEQMYPGIVSQAIFLTFGVLGALLTAYKTGLIKPTENFKLGVVAATGGIALVYLISFIMSLFGGSIPLIHSASPVGIGFSIVVVTIAA